MAKNSSLLLLGSLVIIVSFLGIPSSWKTIVFGALGVLIISVTLLLRKDITTGALCLHLTKEKHTDSYKQNGPLRSNDKESDHESKPDHLEVTFEDASENNTEKKKENEKDQHTTGPQTKY